MAALNTQLFQLPSSEIDTFLGFKINEIEDHLLKKARALRPDGTMDNLGHALHGGHQTWIGLDPQTLNTPYHELKVMCDHLNPKKGEAVLDLGAGYGRLGVVLSVMFPETHFLGYEIVPERVEEGNRVLNELKCLGGLETVDLTSSHFKLPKAQYYFIYDFGKVSHIRQILKSLEEKASIETFKVIARGKGVQSIIEHEHPWLSDIYPIIREENFSIYSMSMEGSLA